MLSIPWPGENFNDQLDMNLLKRNTENHNFFNEAVFHTKSTLLIVGRSFKNFFSNHKRFLSGSVLGNAPVIAISESELWNNDDNEHNWILTAGKVQNLRIAAKRLNCIEVPAGSIFSFWKQVGNPHYLQKYVIGREIKAGCIVPSKAGGICQLSNALYDAALKAGFEIVERHRHTKVISGSLAEKDRDATVKWNYIDLRFRSKKAFRIEAELTAEKLIVKFKSLQQGQPGTDTNATQLSASLLNDCYSCGNNNCFKYPHEKAVEKREGITVLILDAILNEHETYIRKIAGINDIIIVPMKNNLFFKSGLSSNNLFSGKTKAVVTAALKRYLRFRYLIRRQNVFSTSLQLDDEFAKSIAARIPTECTHLIVSQNLLPFLWSAGSMGGRTFDVLMTRLPMEILHQQLDYAHKQYPDSNTLADYRASAKLVLQEATALTAARQIITAHCGIANIFQNKSVRLEWNMPSCRKLVRTSNSRILFPASSLARKGAFEMRRLAKELNLIVVLTGKVMEEDNFWQGITVQYAGADPFDNISIVIFPA